MGFPMERVAGKRQRQVVRTVGIRSGFHSHGRPVHIINLSESFCSSPERNLVLSTSPEDSSNRLFSRRANSDCGDFLEAGSSPLTINRKRCQ